MGRIVRRLRRWRHPSSNFWRGFQEGLAAPTLLFTTPSQKSVYQEANDRIADCWAEVGQHMWDAVGQVDHEIGTDHGRRPD